MELTRRGFLQTLGAAAAASAAYDIIAPSPVYAVGDSSQWKLENTEEFTNICCYCAGGCGSICSVRNGELINIEGDPDHPVNQGALCPKGASMFELRNVIEPDGEVVKNFDRATRPLVRRPRAADWEEISWDDAVAEIARKVKDTRDASFIEKEDGLTVNYTPAIASLGGSQENSEEEYLILKLMRSLGLVAVDNQARVCHSSTVIGLAASFGRGSMTNHWNDMKNTDAILVCGSNSVENHPVSSRWLNKAHENGAKWIVVDPRYTRTAEMADIYCPIRPGTDIAFYGGFFNYIIEHDLWQHDYVLNYTNASYLLDPAYEFDPTTGFFSGWDAAERDYDNASWHYQIESEQEWDTSPDGEYAWVNQPGTPQFTPPKQEVIRKDPTLSDPQCVWQKFKEHYSRYDLDTVCAICGMEKGVLEQVYATYGATGAPDKAGAILYALGQTQHTYGAQNTRAMSILQLLLGNVGICGGGVNALRGEPNVQGATDMGMLVNEQPGYMKWPDTKFRSSLRKWLETDTYSDGYYTNKPKFLVSALKEWFGDAATVDNDYGYDWWPKVSDAADFSIIGTFHLMDQGILKGYFNWGMNPCHSAPNAKFAREAMANLDWLVVADQVLTESATFWKAPGMKPGEIDTTVYFLPCALIYEKPGTILNSGRWMQWRFQAVEPYDQAKPDYEMCDLLFRAIRGLYEEEGGANPEPILNTKWDYYVDGRIDIRPVAWALNGYRTKGADLAQGKVDLLKGYSELQADGSTSCAMWIYSGFYNNNDDIMNPAAQPIGSRDTEDPTGLGLYPQWAFAWPNNRRILYNRASCDLEGKPWNPRKVLCYWDGARWVLNDNADFVAVKDGKPVPPNNKAFFMLWEQNSRLESYAMVDGPLPEHFEPFETPVDKNQLNGQLQNPMLLFGNLPGVERGTVEEFPIVATTYSVTEMWQTGGQSRACPALLESMPNQFIEISKELAAEKGIRSNDEVRVFNRRGEAVVPAIVTNRFKPLMIDGKLRHQIGITHHFGWAGVFGTGDVVNVLTPNVGDPNCYIPEFKAFLVDIERV